MVGTVTKISRHTPIFMKGQSPVVEIVGPAGAGKTTLVLELQQRNKNIQAVVSFRRVGYVPIFASSMLLLLPTFLRRSQNGNGFSGQEMRMMTHLQALHHLLERRASHAGTVTILDQGPVYMLARLHEFGFENIQDRGFQRWWISTLDRWACTLDMVIRLDAPDAILVERIRARSKQHLLKEKPEQEAICFLASFRASCQQIISELTASDGPKVLCFNTEQESLDRIIRVVFTALDSKSDNG